jgi:hypothetical protein
VTKKKQNKQDYRKEKLYQKGVNETIRAMISFLKHEEKMVRNEVFNYARSEKFDSAFERWVEAELYRYLADSLKYGEIDRIDELLPREEQ